MKHSFGIGSGDGYSIIMLEVDAVTKEEGVDGGAPDAVWTDSHSEEYLVRIAEAALMCVFMYSDVRRLTIMVVIVHHTSSDALTIHLRLSCTISTQVNC